MQNLNPKAQNIFQNNKLQEDRPLCIGGLTLYPGEFKAERNGKPVRLRKKEYQLLEFLAINKNRVINRNTILEYVWNYNVNSMTNTLEVHIANLRRKIDDEFSKKILQTVYGIGYKLCDAVDPSIGYEQEPRASGTVATPSPVLPNTSEQHPAGDLSSAQHPVPP